MEDSHPPDAEAHAEGGDDQGLLEALEAAHPAFFGCLLEGA